LLSISRLLRGRRWLARCAASARNGAVACWALRGCFAAPAVGALCSLDTRNGAVVLLSTSSLLRGRRRARVGAERSSVCARGGARWAL